MNKTDCFQLGYIAKLHGFKGEVSLFLDVSTPEDYYNLHTIYIDINGLLTPFSIDSLKVKNKGFIAVKLVGVNREVDAQKLVRKTVYLPDTLLPELSGKHFYDHEIIGFSVEDEQYGNIGTVIQVLDLPANPLIAIDKEGVEILLPLQDGLIQCVDRPKKHLRVNSPPGLLALYLE